MNPHQGVTQCPEWPMIVLRTPRAGLVQGVDGHKVEDFCGLIRCPLKFTKIPLTEAAGRMDAELQARGIV